MFLLASFFVYLIIYFSFFSSLHFYFSLCKFTCSVEKKKEEKKFFISSHLIEDINFFVVFIYKVNKLNLK